MTNPVNAYQTQADEAIAFARAQIGKPYAWGHTGPDSYDCSGLVYAAYESAGVKLGRTTIQQIADGVAVKSEAELLPGDLRFPDAGHVQLSVGNGQIIEAPTQGENVRQTSAWGSFFAGRRVAMPGSSIATEDVSLSGGVSQVETLFNKLTDPETYIRAGMILGGIVLVVMGLLMVTGKTSAAKDALKGLTRSG